MSKPFPLQVLLDLARNHADEAAARLGALNQQQRAMSERLGTLLAYREEYASNLKLLASNGMQGSDWRNFQDFMGKIDMAIAQQRQMVEDASAHMHAGQVHWQAEQRKLRSYDTLSTRHGERERQVESRLAQKEQDAFALRINHAARMAG